MHQRRVVRRIAAARPRSQQEGPARDAEWIQTRRSGARGRYLLTHGGGRDVEWGGHFRARFACLASLGVSDAAASALIAFVLRIDGPLSLRR